MRRTEHGGRGKDAASWRIGRHAGESPAAGARRGRGDGLPPDVPGPGPRLARVLAVLLALGGPGAAPAAAQDGSPAAPSAADEPSPPAAGLNAAEAARCRRAIERFTTSKEAARTAAVEEVVALGRGALPLLLEQADTAHAHKQEALVRCLVALVDARDEALLLESLPSEHVVLRRFAARAAGTVGTPALVAALAARVDDDDPEVAAAAALGLVRHGDPAGLSGVARAWLASLPPATSGAERGRGRRAQEPDPAAEEAAAALRAQIADALPGLSGKGRHEPLQALLAIDREREERDPAGAAAERRAAVAMLAAIGDRPAIDLLGRTLDDPHNLVQRDAIDALRHLLEQAPPFQGGSIFAQINEVERLKGVLPRGSGRR